MNVHFMSVNMFWQTPDDVYADLDAEFGFDFDPCPPDPQHDGLDGLFDQREWGSSNFMNPPYGKAIAMWMKKAFEQSQLGKTVVCLVPSRTDTKWWHDYAMKAKEIRFIKGRLKFKGATNSAPFPSAIIVFKED